MQRRFVHDLLFLSENDYICDMNVEDLRDFCLSIDEQVEEGFPFAKFPGGKNVLVFYIFGSMFAYFNINDLSCVCLKCQPEKIVDLVERYPYIGAPYNGHAKHWIGVNALQADTMILKELIVNSYQIVAFQNQSKKIKS